MIPSNGEKKTEEEMPDKRVDSERLYIKKHTDCNENQSHYPNYIFCGKHAEFLNHVYTNDNAALHSRFENATKNVAQCSKKKLNVPISIRRTMKNPKEGDTAFWNPSISLLQLQMQARLTQRCLVRRPGSTCSVKTHLAIIDQQFFK